MLKAFVLKLSYKTTLYRNFVILHRNVHFYEVCLFIDVDIIFWGHFDVFYKNNFSYALKFTYTFGKPDNLTCYFPIIYFFQE